MAVRISCPSCNCTGRLSTTGFLVLVGIGWLSPNREPAAVASGTLPPTLTASPANAPAEPRVPPVDNPRVTPEAFNQIRWLMPSQDITSILGRGEQVANSVVLGAMGPEPATRAELYERVEGGLWMQWKGKNRTIFVQFGGPTVVKNQDGSYSIGPNTQCGLVLFITENSSTGMRDVSIDWKLGPRRGHIRQWGWW